MSGDKRDLRTLEKHWREVGASQTSKTNVKPKDWESHFTSIDLNTDCLWPGHTQDVAKNKASEYDQNTIGVQQFASSANVLFKCCINTIQQKVGSLLNFKNPDGVLKLPSAKKHLRKAWLHWKAFHSFRWKAINVRHFFETTIP